MTFVCGTRQQQAAQMGQHGQGQQLPQQLLQLSSNMLANPQLMMQAQQQLHMQQQLQQQQQQQQQQVLAHPMLTP